MRFAYADPPYLGMGRLYDAHHADSRAYDDPEAHRDLIASLAGYDGWTMSLHVPSLRTILPMVPETARICAWVKPFASFKPNVRQAWAWEPIIVMPMRRKSKDQRTTRDWVSANIAMKKGLPGAKPETVAFWLFDFIGAEPGDDFIDVFPGTGIMSDAWARWSGSGLLETESMAMGL